MKKAWKALLALLVISALLAGCVPAAPAQQAQTTAAPASEAPELVLLTPEPEEETPDSTAAAVPSREPAATPAPTPEATATPKPTATPAPTPTPCPVTEDGVYDSKDEVALYIHLYRHLPSNYITKSKAEKLGWPGGSLEPYAPGKCIGGGRFGNYEGLLPNAKGRQYYECDIGTLGARSRGPKRIIYSNDGLIYYTPDHYESFELLYGEE